MFFCLLFELFSVPFIIDIGIPFSLVCKYRKWLVAYLIFVIYFTQAGLLNPNIAVFRAQYGKIDTDFITQAPPVVPVTNMRYG